MQSLILHPSCNAGPITGVSASVTATESGCDAEFRFVGDISAIKVPHHAPACREDNLWQTTCFEIFWQPLGGTYYREFNLSPSSKWACYDFDAFREGMRDAPVDAIAIACSHTDRELVLKASIASELPVPAQVALNAIVEHPDGSLQFWALDFPEGKAEFHSEVCRQWQIESR